MSRLSLYIMGPPRIDLDGEPVKLDSHKAIALLIILALSNQSHPRDALITLLWPECDPSHGHTNLRHSLYLLRKTIRGEWLQADRETIRLNPDADIWLDVTQFHRYLSDYQVHRHTARDICPECVSSLTAAIKLYRGDFLSGFGLKDSLEFDDWQLIHAETLRRELAEVLERLMQYHSSKRAFETALEIGRQWLALDRLNEGVHCQLMELYARSGQRAGALRQYQECMQILHQELGIPPQAETTACYEAIVKGEWAQRAVDIPDDIFPIPFSGREPSGVKSNVFVARESELARLYRRVNLAITGHGQVVFVTGDAGRGKTALLQEFTQRAQERWSDLVVAGGNCNAYTGEGDPYLPFREVLGFLTGDIDALWAAGTIQREHAHRLWDTFPLVVRALVETGPDLLNTIVPAAALLRRAIAYSAGGLGGQAGLLRQLQKLVEQKAAGLQDPNLQQRTLFEQFARLLMALGRERPLLLVLDDLQWVDEASVGLLIHLGRHLSGQRILIAGAYRAEEVSIGRRGERHPLEVALHDLQRVFGDIFIDLEQAEGRHFVTQYLETEPNRLTAGFRETLYQQTGGHPLFTVELLRGMQERGDLVKDNEGYWLEGKALDWSKLPGRVEAVIAERIARLDETSRQVLEVASVEGETFTAEVVGQINSTGEQEIVQHLSTELDRRHRLVRAQEIQHLGVRRISRYRFQHILYQTYLYHNLDPAARMYLHEAVGNALESLYGEDAQEIAVSLARHFQQAGLISKALAYLLTAGQKARQSSANAQAISYLTQGLELLKTLPDTPQRALKELEYRLTLGVPLVLTLGHAATDVEMNYLRARELSVQSEDAYQRIQALMGLRRFYHVRGKLGSALEVSEQILALAQNLEPVYLARAFLLRGEILYRMGCFQKAQEDYLCCDAMLASTHDHSDVHLFGNDTLVINQVFQGVNLWQLGSPDQAVKVSLAGIARARQLAHPFTLVCALIFCAELHDFRREPAAVKEKLEELLAICKERGFALYSAWGTQLIGRTQVAQNQIEEGIAQILHGLEGWKATGAELSLPGFLANLAEAYWQAGQTEKGLHCLTEALSRLAESGERVYQPELYRLQGELIQAQGGAAGEVETCFQHALSCAQDLGARSWELRAAWSLSRLWLVQGKISQIPELLAGIYHGFKEGLDAPELLQAETLLKQVSPTSHCAGEIYQEEAHG